MAKDKIQKTEELNEEQLDEVSGGNKGEYVSHGGIYEIEDPQEEINLLIFGPSN